VLLEVLGQGSDPLAVQKHLRALFDNVARAHFESSGAGGVVVAKLESAEGEELPLAAPVPCEVAFLLASLLCLLHTLDLTRATWRRGWARCWWRPGARSKTPCGTR
jgi:hypothetical protein